MAAKSVLITGCSDDGIGSGLALTFQKQGYQVFATARNLDKMTKLSGVSNVTLRSLNVLVNNAGRNHFMPYLDEDVEQVKALYDINVWGPLRVTKAFAPLLIKTQGSIAFITSISGYLNVPFMGTYAGSKRALELMADTLRLELIPFHVKVLCIPTGAVRTQGQTYFGDFKLPDNSLYKPIEETIAARAQGQDGVERMPLMDYSSQVAAQIENGATGRFWCGANADRTKATISGDSNDMMDDIFVKITRLDSL
ncbi:short-chain dehydrogenase [Aspergillus bombycis]|uniref:Short-chain dehydrogenase n=1 Tax=Aspergillus bombycis TaxID=109264 RepID=A0A1F7ZT68_9EURO|nr:short-chain dehydrogenase [Aspergillus bombycis]OGM42617.1 short-chain dehydrogenase [Aspergillus bombycis]